MLPGRDTAQVAYAPTWVDRGSGLMITPVAAALRDPATPAATRAALERSWDRTVRAVGLLGAAAAGVVPTGEP